MANILIIDDDRVFCDVLSRAVSRAGHSAVFSLTLKDGLDAVSSGNFDVVMLDVQLPDGNGLTAIPKIRETVARPEVIIITGSGDPDGAELAIRCGAWDYIEKPASTDAMTLPLIRAVEYRKEKQAQSQLLTLDRRGIIGDSPVMQACLGQLAQAARGDINVFITGETGTGKELLARTIHKNSLRAAEPFVVVDCSALPESLVESILFGHAKGAFTGADKSHAGLIKQADGGTLFLDEVGELPLPLQKAFLRVLQEYCYRPIGGNEEEQSDFRLITATNRNLDDMVRNGEFREDLLYRIRAIAIQSPPLRDRTEDIKDLTVHHVTRFCDKSRILMKGFSPDFFRVLGAYHWPGNIRELFHVVDSALFASLNEPILYPNHLPVNIRTCAARAALKKDAPEASHFIPSIPQDSRTSAPPPSYKDYRTRFMEDAEKNYFIQIVSHSSGDIKEACRLSGLSRSRLYFFLQKHGISLSGSLQKEPGDS